MQTKKQKKKERMKQRKATFKLTEILYITQCYYTVVNLFDISVHVTQTKRINEKKKATFKLENMKRFSNTCAKT